MRPVHYVAYALLALTFVALLFSAADPHYDQFLRHRLDPPPGGANFTHSRILTVYIMKPMVGAGLHPSLASKILILATTIGTLLAFREFLLQAAGIPEDYSTFLAPLILVPMSWNYIVLSAIHYPEDIASMLLFIMGLIFLTQGREVAFHTVFLLAIVNRETSIFLVPAMFLLEMKRRKILPLVIHCLVLTAVWFAGRELLVWLFGGGADSRIYEDQIAHNVRFFKDMLLLKPKALLMLMIFGGLWVLVPFCIGRAPRRLMLLTLLIVPFFLVMFKAGALYGEARIFNEMIPVITAPVIAAFYKEAVGED